MVVDLFQTIVDFGFLCQFKFQCIVENLILMLIDYQLSKALFLHLNFLALRETNNGSIIILSLRCIMCAIHSCVDLTNN